MNAMNWPKMGWLALLGFACGIEASPMTVDQNAGTAAESGMHGPGMRGPGMNGGHQVMLGRHLFFDSDLSKNRNQSARA
jgi:hypothetical protein